jgi:uncharacterized protein (TIGR03000 family)
MLRIWRRLAILLTLAAAAFLGTPARSLAQRGGPGHGGPGVGGAHEGYYGGGAYGVRYGPYGYGDHRFWGYGGGFYGPYDGYFPYYYGYYPYYGLDVPPYYGPNPYAIPGYPPAPPYLGNSSTTAAPATVAGAGYNAVSPTVQAKVIVTVPSSNTKLWFQDNLTATTGPVREFQTPPLPPGGTFSYRIRAEWEQDGRTMSQMQTLNVVAGQIVRIAFPTQSTGQGY